MSWLPDYQRAAAQSTDIAHYLPILFGYAARYPGVRIVELGTDIGESTTALLAAAQVAEGHVWSVDHNPRIEFARVHDAHSGMGRWTWICDDTRAAAAKVPGRIDVLFVDASHLYDETCAEIEVYLPKVVPGGVALFHDTDKPGTDDKVREALDDTLQQWNLTWHEIPGRCGLGVVHVDRALAVSRLYSAA